MVLGEVVAEKPGIIGRLQQLQADIGFTATSDNELAKEAADFVGAIVEHIQPALNAEVSDISEIENLKDITNETTRKQLIDARRGRVNFVAVWSKCGVDVQ
jgi:hypothetical protein